MDGRTVSTVNEIILFHVSVCVRVVWEFSHEQGTRFVQNHVIPWMIEIPELDSILLQVQLVSFVVLGMIHVQNLRRLNAL